jgi:F-type H+-transporting ATPase subunit delta
MKIDELAGGYAKGLLELALAEDALEKTGEELLAVSKTVKSNLKLKEVFEGKGGGPEARKGIITGVFRGKISPVTLGFLLLMAETGREKLFFETVRAYTAAAAARRNTIIAEVVSAVPMDEKSLAALAETLGKKLDKQVEVRAKIDSNILGGFVVKVGDKLIDASLKNKLETFRKEIKAD